MTPPSRARQVRQQELEYYITNFETMGVQATMLAGWLFDQVTMDRWGRGRPWTPGVDALVRTPCHGPCFVLCNDPAGIKAR